MHLSPDAKTLKAPIQLRGLLFLGRDTDRAPMHFEGCVSGKLGWRKIDRCKPTARRSVAGRTRLGTTSRIDPNLSPGKSSPRLKQKETPRNRCPGFYKLLPQLEALSNLTACGVGGSGARRSDRGLYQR
jgi:hypothetical protein